MTYRGSLPPGNHIRGHVKILRWRLTANSQAKQNEPIPKGKGSELRAGQLSCSKMFKNVQIIFISVLRKQSSGWYENSEEGLSPIVALCAMGKAKGRAWDFFHEGGMQNLSHHRAYCLGCVETHRPAAMASDAIDVDAPQAGTKEWLEAQPWFRDAGKTWAKKEKAGKSKQKNNNNSDSGTGAEAPARKRKRFQRVEKEMKQTQLQPLAVPKARHKNFHFGRFLILAKELLLSPRALIRLT
ncbi:hypothetical protein C8R44DRAFT_746350 [Mycena epipterygia]|nr:hypothetical protein C8R44DRAFT_746350 [Mycena epipterygia]